MRARVYDWLAVDEPPVGGRRRVGPVVAAEHRDGASPYRIRWTDTDHRDLFSPWPDAHVQPRDAHSGVQR